MTAFPKSHRIDRYEEGCPYEKFARKPFNTFSSLTTHKPQHTHTHTLIDVHAAIACAVFYSEITQRETGKHCFLPTSRYWEPPSTHGLRAKLASRSKHDSSKSGRISAAMIQHGKKSNAQAIRLLSYLYS